LLQAVVGSKASANVVQEAVDRLFAVVDGAPEHEAAPRLISAMLRGPGVGKAAIRRAGLAALARITPDTYDDDTFGLAQAMLTNSMIDAAHAERVAAHVVSWIEADNDSDRTPHLLVLLLRCPTLRRERLDIAVGLAVAWLAAHPAYHNAAEVADALPDDRSVPAYRERAATPLPRQDGPEGRAERSASFVLLVDSNDQVLLSRGVKRSMGSVGWTAWTPPGRRVAWWESRRRVAARSLWREMGLRVRSAQLGPVVSSRSSDGGAPSIRHDYFLVRVERRLVDRSIAESSRRHEFRWWGVDEIRATADEVKPAELVDLLAGLLDVGHPGPPVERLT
jgi:ADP-ribose pyrophosphatase YjhB (NUDIX family)